MAMNTLVDTNIFLSILLDEDKASICKQYLIDAEGKLFISDFSLHSIGVITFRLGKKDTFDKFVADILPMVEIASLPWNSYNRLRKNSNDFSLDFDDAYQFGVAISNNLSIATMDKDFRKVEEIVPVEFL